jgi:hypothetical protein
LELHVFRERGKCFDESHLDHISFG